MSFQKSSKDIKRFISKFLDDRDILNYCIIDKNQHGNVCNEDFFYNILISRYPDTLKYKPEDTSFKKWYLSVIHYIDLLKREYGFNYRQYNEGNPKRQYEIFGKLKDKRNMNKLLTSAAKRGELTLVRFALGNGADIHIRSDIALVRASENGNLDVVQYLVQHGVNVDAKNRALAFASQNGHFDIVKYLVENGANIHAYEDTALRWASSNGHLEVVKYLVQHGANIHAWDDWALRWARKSKHLEVVQYLESLP